MQDTGAPGVATAPAEPTVRSGVAATSPESRELLVVLARRFAFREVAYLLGARVVDLGLDDADLAQVQQLCSYGQRLLDLDAQSLADPDAAAGATTDTTFAILAGTARVPGTLVARGAHCSLRRAPSPAAGAGDALDDLRPLYRLLLEAVRVRWHRYETLSLLALVHLAGEYAPMLAWQPVLGHAGDPWLLREDRDFTGAGSRFGHLDDPRCPRPKAEKAAMGRALRVADEPPPGWQAYLDRQASVVAKALAGCATDCPTPCTVMTARPDPARDRLAQACSLAVAYQGCSLVRLRHRALVGHAFGVPSRDEVGQAWEHSRRTIARRGQLAGAVLTDDGFPLPGLAALFGAIAGDPLTPDTLLHDTRDAIVTLLDPDGLVW